MTFIRKKVSCYCLKFSGLTSLRHLIHLFLVKLIESSYCYKKPIVPIGLAWAQKANTACIDNEYMKKG